MTGNGRRATRFTTAQRSGCVLAIALLIVACTDSRSSSPSSTSEPVATTQPGRATTTSGVRPSGQVEVPHEVVDGFDDHTVSQIASVGEFHALARPGISAESVVKFSIPTMDSSDDVRWMDSNFYSLHDEWYWFRLLNGRSVPGFDTQPVNGPQLRTVEEIYAWAGSRAAADLPLDLRFIDSSAYGRRLYSDDFYRLGFPGDVRNYGLGSLVYLPDAADGGEHWLIELEFSDSPSADEVAHYFDLLMATLPAEIGNALEWVIRSPEQEAVAQEMAAAELRFHDRIVRYRELVPAGQVAVYNPGIAAGRLLLVDGVNTQLGDATENDIVLVEDVPDWLPPASALISSSPQTPLAHVNLLARNRGIPNASQAGLLDDVGLRQAARVRAHAIVRATPDGQLDVVLITADEYATGRQLGRTTPISVPPVDTATMPTVVDLIQLSGSVANEAEIDAWRPIIGGKSAGFLSLLAAPGVTTPQNPLAITVAPYLEHLDQVSGELDAMLADPDFRNSARVRFLLLEGLDDYADSYPDAADADLAEAIIAKHPIGTPLADILDAGGFKGLFRDVEINPATLARDRRQPAGELRRLRSDPGSAIPFVQFGRGHRGLHRRRPVRLEHRLPRPRSAARRRRPQEDDRENDQEDVELVLGLRSVRGTPAGERRSPQRGDGGAGTRSIRRRARGRQRRRHLHAASRQLIRSGGGDDQCPGRRRERHQPRSDQ